MPDLFEGDPPEDAFALPGDDAKIEAMQAVAEEAPVEPVAEVEVETAEDTGPARDEQGRFVSQQEDEAEVAADAAANQADDIRDKRLADKDDFIRRQAEELRELRQVQEAMWQQQQYQQQQQHSAGMDWETLIDTNPAQATQLAYQQGNQAAYYQAVQAWEEVAPGAPELWSQNLAMRQQVDALAQESQAQRGMQAIDSLIRQYPDFEQQVDRIIEILPRYPHEGKALVSQNPNEVLAAMESLYLKATRGPVDPATLAAQVQETARKLAHDEQQAVAEASVVTASRTQKEPALSTAQAIGASWDTEAEKRLNDGWNI